MSPSCHKETEEALDEVNKGHWSHMKKKSTGNYVYHLHPTV